MPFTLAHPAAVLPLRRWLCLPALVAGSVAPDVASYLPVPGGLGATHTLTAAVSLDVVLGAVVLVAFVVARGPLIAVAPAGLRARLGGAPWWVGNRGLGGAAVVVVSIAAGAITHVLWDMVTHARSPLVRAWPWLRATVVGPHTVYNVIGYVSAVGGLVIIGVTVAGWYRRTPPTARGVSPTRQRRLLVVALVLAGAAGAAAALTAPEAWITGYDVVRHTLIGTTRGALVVLGGYALLWHAATWGRRRTTVS
ncbi:DUF4184 family protein [Pseudonocardia sp. TRM90224]|uniref:DUF4184 family protein n=1 Tax=Pseudonocardia sp. TRM90224 TaxID=2812678 RepID=UPI001E486D68|nr:DUF4184 family protein [Pseudonocardia sp. TRM90224]